MSIFTDGARKNRMTEATVRLDAAHTKVRTERAWDNTVAEFGGERFTVDNVRAILNDIEILTQLVDRERERHRLEEERLRTLVETVRNRRLTLKNRLLTLIAKADGTVTVAKIARAAGITLK